MNSKNAVVTGATAGIGKEIARGLVKLGAKLIIGVRDVEKGRAVARELGGDVTVLQVDTSSPASIRQFAAGVNGKIDRLHVLINNAGAWYSDRRTSPEGRELTFATNVVGPYALSEELLPLLKAGAPSRIVNVVSGLASDYDASDLDFTKRKYDGFKVYGASKAAARMVSFGAARRLEGSGVSVFAAAPGFVRTEFNKNARGFIASMINLSAKLFAITPAQGADAILYAATAPELEGKTGLYLDRKVTKPSKYTEPALITELEQKLQTMARA